MRIGRLIRYGIVASLAGAAGFLLGGGKMPDELEQAAAAVTERARYLAEALPHQDDEVTGALNDARETVADSLKRVSGLLDQ